MKVKYLVEEEVTILRQGVIELDLQAMQKNQLDNIDLSNEEEVKEIASTIFDTSLNSEDSFSDEVRQSEKFNSSISVKRIDAEDNSIYFDRLPIKEAL